MSSGDWPHDPDGDEASQGMRKYGHAILAKKIDEPTDFPLSGAGFVGEHGDEPVRIDDRRVVSVADIFERVDRETVEGMQSFHRAVGEAVRADGFWPYVSE